MALRVRSYTRHTKSGKTVQVESYTSSRDAAQTLLAVAEGHAPPMAGVPAAQSAVPGVYPLGQTAPGVFPPNPKKPAPSAKRFAQRADDARTMQGQTQGHFKHHGTGHAMGKTEIGDTYEQMFFHMFSHKIEDKYGKVELVTGAGSGTARNTPLDFRTPSHGGELKTLNINSKNQKTAIKAEEIQRKLGAIEKEGLQPLLLVQVVDQDTGTVHVYGMETFASKAVSKMEHLGEYQYDTADFQRAQENSGHAAKAAGRAEAERAASAGSGDLGGSGRGASNAVGGKQHSAGKSGAGGSLTLEAKPQVAVTGEEAKKLLVEAQAGGFTYSPAGKTSPKTGYSVSPYPEKTQVVEASALTAELIQTFAENNKDLLSQPGHHIGGWRETDPVTGVDRVWLDVSIVSADQAEAKATAVKFDQKAIFDLGGGNVIDTGGSGGQEVAALPGAEHSGGPGGAAEGSTGPQEGQVKQGQAAGAADLGQGGRDGHPAAEAVTGEALLKQKGLNPHLHSDEEDALIAYTRNNYRDFNEYMRFGTPLADQSQEDQIRALRDAINKGETETAATVFRGTSADAFPANMQPGSVITDRGFVSTTVDAKVAEDYFNFGAVMHIDLPKGTPALNASTGMNSDERELLLQAGGRFEVVSDEPKNGPLGHRVIHVKWLSPDQGGGVHSHLSGAIMGFSAPADFTLSEAQLLSLTAAVRRVRDAAYWHLPVGTPIVNHVLDSGQTDKKGGEPYGQQTRQATRGTAATYQGGGSAGRVGLLPPVATRVDQPTEFKAGENPADFAVGPGLVTRAFGTGNVEPSEGVKRAITRFEQRVPGAASMVDHVGMYPHSKKPGVLAEFFTFTQMKARGLKGPAVEIYLGDIKPSQTALRGNHFAMYGEAPAHGSIDLDQLHEGIVAHELGHSVYTLLREDQKKSLHRIAAKAFGEVYDQDTGLDLKVVTNNDFSFLTLKHAKAIKSGLSKYGTASRDEFFAECWAEYSTNPNARPLARTVGEAMERFAHENHGEPDKVYGPGPVKVATLAAPPTPPTPAADKLKDKLEKHYTSTHTTKFAVVKDGKVIKLLDQAGKDVSTKQGLWNWNKNLKAGKLKEAGADPGGTPLQLPEGQPLEGVDALAHVSQSMRQPTAKDSTGEWLRYQAGQNAAEYYAKDGYSDWNGYLRGKFPASEEDKQRIELLRGRLARSVITEPIVLYRGTGMHAIGEVQVGSVITDKAFVSTSPNKTVGEFFQDLTSDASAALLRIHAPAGTQALDMRGLVQGSHEDEVLLPPGTQFRVVKDSPAAKGWGKIKKAHPHIIDVEVLPLDPSVEPPHTTVTAEQTRALWKAADDEREKEYLDKKSSGSSSRGRGRSGATMGFSAPNEARLLDSILALTNSTEDAWAQAAFDGIKHVTLVLKNNPGSSVADSLGRPDVHEALLHAGSSGAEAVIADITQVWLDNGGDPESPYLASLLNDAQHNGEQYIYRMSAALAANDHSAAKSLLEKDRIRAAAGGDVAATRARAEAMIASLQHQGVSYKVWRAHVDDRTCQWCLALDGAIVLLGEQFPVSGPEPYFDLACPPRHPNCRCYLDGSD